MTTPWIALLLVACTTPGKRDTSPVTETDTSDSSPDSPVDTTSPPPPDTGVDTVPGLVTDLVRISEIMAEPRRSEPRETFDGANWGTYDEIDSDGALEYVELFNAGSDTVDLAGWSFTNGIDYTFPSGTLLAAGAWVVVAADPVTFASYHGIDALGPFAGALDNDGETLELTDSLGVVADTVTYAVLPPWPVRPGTDGASLERVCPDDERATVEFWRSGTAVLPEPLVGTGTPGAANSVEGEVPPFIWELAHTPAIPAPGDTVTLTARVSSDVTLVAVRLETAPDDGAASSTDMADDGAHGDGLAGDGVYGASVSAGSEGELTHYRVHAETASSATVYPYDDEPSPTRAFATTAYTGDTHAWHLFMQGSDVDTLRSAAATHPQDDPEVDGTLVVEGVAFPHILVSLGGRWNRANPPYQWHFSLHPDATLDGATSLHANPYSVETQDAVFDAFDLVLDPALCADPVYIQYTRDGVDQGTLTYIAYEAPNGQWLETRGYDDATEVYKSRTVESDSPRRNSDLFWFGDLGDERADNGLQTDANFWGAYKKGERALEPPTHIEELVAALNDLPDEDLLPWLDAHVDVEQVFTSYALHIYLRIDDFAGHNNYLLLPGDTGKWQILNYDFDGFARYSPLSLLYATGLRSDESQDWQRNMLHRRIAQCPTLTRVYYLYARHLLETWTPDALVPRAYVSSVKAARDSIQSELSAADLPSEDDAPAATPCGGAAGTVTITAGTGWDVYATMDDSDPRLSATRVAVGGSVVVEDGTTLRLAGAEAGYPLEDGRWTDEVRCGYSED